MQLHPFRATLPKLEFVTSPEEFFKGVKEEYNDYADNGFFRQTEEPAFYLYRIKKSGRFFTGLVACVDMRETSREAMIPHEQTLATKEQRQIHLLLKRKATVKPILLTYEGVDRIDYLLREISEEEPLLRVDFTHEDQTHEVWAIRDTRQIEELQHLFAERVEKTYIADGHHRCATAYRLSKLNGNTPYRKTVCALFPASDLEIHDFNRVIDAFSQCSPTYFMASLSQICNIEIMAQPTKPRKKHEMLLLINEEWYLLSWKEKVFTELGYSRDALDTQLLNDLILDDILDIKNVSTNPRITYVEGPRGIDGLRDMVMADQTNIGIALYPVQATELFALANTRTVLPPKSTWFEPRLKNGLIGYQYEFH